MLATEVLAGVVLRMPPAPVRQVASAASVVTPLQRFAVGEPAKDRAGNVILQQVTDSPQIGNSDWGGYGGYGWGGYGYGGYGWGGYGGWGYGPVLFVECCSPCRPVRPICGTRPTGMVFGSGLMGAW